MKKYLLLGVSLIIVVIAIMINLNENNNELNDDKYLFNKMESKLSKIDSIKILHKNQKYNIKKQNDIWIINDSFLGDKNSIDNLLLKLSFSQIIEKKTDNKKLYKHLDLEDIKEANSSSVYIQLDSQGKKLYSLLVGKKIPTNFERNKKSYVRIDKQSWLVSKIDKGLFINHNNLRKNTFSLSGSIKKINIDGNIYDKNDTNWNSTTENFDEKKFRNYIMKIKDLDLITFVKKDINMSKTLKEITIHTNNDHEYILRKINKTLFEIKSKNDEFIKNLPSNWLIEGTEKKLDIIFNSTFKKKKK